MLPGSSLLCCKPSYPANCPPNIPHLPSFSISNTHVQHRNKLLRDQQDPGRGTYLPLVCSAGQRGAVPHLGPRKEEPLPAPSSSELFPLCLRALWYRALEGLQLWPFNCGCCQPRWLGVPTQTGCWLTSVISFFAVAKNYLCFSVFHTDLQVSASDAGPNLRYWPFVPLGSVG